MYTLRHSVEGFGRGKPKCDVLCAIKEQLEVKRRVDKGNWDNKRCFCLPYIVAKKSLGDQLRINMDQCRKS